MIKRQLFIVLILLNIQSFAQYNKGQLMVNGNIHYYMNKSNTSSDIRTQQSKQHGYGSNLNIGYFFTNHFAFGLNCGINEWGSKSNVTDTVYISDYVSTNKIRSLGIFLRYNQPIYKSKFGFFLQLGSNYSFIKYHDESTYTSINYPSNTSIYEQQGRGYDYYLNPGLFYFVNNRLSIEAGLGSLTYTHTNFESIPDSPYTNPYFRKQSDFNANFSISSVFLGATFYLGKNKNAASDSPAAETK